MQSIEVQWENNTKYPINVIPLHSGFELQNIINRLTVRFFTLIELLLVVAIIAILVSILLPALYQARKTTYSILCKSNLKQLGFCANTYANSYDAYVPSAYNCHRESGKKQWTSYYKDESYINGKTDAEEYDMNITGRITNDVTRCPSFAMNLSKRFSTQHYGCRISGDGGTFTDGYGYGYYRIHGSNIKCFGSNGNPIECGDYSPSAFMLYADTLSTYDSLYSQWYIFYDTCSNTTSSTGIIGLRHRRRTNASFLDGSVRALDKQQILEAGVAESQIDNILFTNQ